MQPLSALLLSTLSLSSLFGRSAGIKHCTTYIRAKYCIKETWRPVIIILYSSFDSLPPVLFPCLSIALQANPGTGSLLETKDLEQTNEAAYGVWHPREKWSNFPVLPLVQLVQSRLLLQALLATLQDHNETRGNTSGKKRGVFVFCFFSLSPLVFMMARWNY